MRARICLRAVENAEPCQRVLAALANAPAIEAMQSPSGPRAGEATFDPVVDMGWTSGQATVASVSLLEADGEPALAEPGRFDGSHAAMALWHDATVGTLLALAVIPALALSTPQTPDGAPAPEPVVCDGARFRIECLPGDLGDALASKLAQEALAVAEGAWPVFEKAIQPKSPTKATLRLHADNAVFLANAKRLQPDQLYAGVVVAPDGFEAHVMLARIAPSALARFGLPPSTRRTLLFAAAKQLALRQLGDRADDWLSDMIGLGLSEDVMNPQRRLGVDLLFDQRRMIVVHSVLFSSATELVGVVGMIKPANDAGELDMYYRRLALLAEQLSVRSPGWPRRLIAAWPKPPADAVTTDGRYPPIEALLGKEWSRTQERFERSYQGAKMPWEAYGETWRRGDEWIVAGQPKYHSGVMAFKQTPASDWSMRCQLQWEATDERYCPRVAIDWNGKTCIQLQFAPGQLTVERWEHPRLVGAGEPVPIDITIGEPVDFRADVVGKRLTVFVNGKRALEQAFPARSMHEAFGFSIERSVLHVRQLKVEAIR